MLKWNPSAVLISICICFSCRIFQFTISVYVILPKLSLLVLNVGNGWEWGVAGIIIDSYCGSFPHSLHLAPVSIKVSEVQKYYHTRPQRCPKMVDNSLLVKPSFFCAIGMYRYLLGGIPTYLARKMMEWKSVGIMTFPICIYTHIYMENKSCSKPATRYVRFVRLNHVESPWHRLNFA